MRRLALWLVAALVSVPAGAQETFVVDKNHSEASFQVRHMMVSKVRGRFNDFAGVIRVDRAKPEASSVEFTIQAASIDTNVEARDKDLRSDNFFDVEKYPTLTFKSSKVAKKDADHYDVTGTLTMHGVSKDVVLPITLLGFAKDPKGTERVGFEGTLSLSRKDYGLLWNQVIEGGGVVVSDEVQVTLNVEAKKQAAPSN